MKYFVDTYILLSTIKENSVLVFDGNTVAIG